MNKATKTNDGPVRIFQYVTNTEECDPVQLPLASQITIQVEGDLGGEQVVIFGGINSANVPIESVSSTPALIQIHGVRLVKPVAPPGITITIMGIQ